MAKKTRVLVIGDLHAPFIHEGYAGFVKGVADDINPTHVIQIGDLVDQHVISRHEPHPDALGTLEELRLAKEQLSEFYSLFPKVTVTVGNHDERIARQAATAKIPSIYLRKLLDVLDAPKGWRLVKDIEIEGVRYLHGTGSGGANHASNLAKAYGQSIVTGHVHSNLFVKYHASPNQIIFGMNVGCGVAPDSYAMEYARDHIHRPALGCGTVIGGQVANVCPMDLGSKIRRITNA